MSKLNTANKANKENKETSIDNDESPQTAAQYIYNTMLDQSNKPITSKRPSLRKMSSMEKSSNRSLGLLSLDMFPEDFEVHYDGNVHDLARGGGLLSQTDSKRSINSSDFVKDVILSGSSSELPLTSLRETQSSHSPALVNLTAKLERITTGDDIMGENIRLSSEEWVKDFEKDYGSEDVKLGPMPQSMFYDNGATAGTGPSPVLSSSHTPPPLSVGLSPVLSSSAPPLSVGLSPVLSSSEAPVLSLPPLQIEETNTIPEQTKTTSKSTTKKSTKKRRQRVIDTTTSCEPTDADVLFGRGGYTNNRPGNIHFRAEALRLRPWYEASSKEEKYEISNILLESVKSRGGRFLEKGQDGMWHEVIGNGARRKASQALRERIKGSAKGVLGSSLNSGKYSEGEERDDLVGVKKYEV